MTAEGMGGDPLQLLVLQNITTPVIFVLQTKPCVSGLMNYPHVNLPLNKAIIVINQKYYKEKPSQKN